MIITIIRHAEKAEIGRGLSWWGQIRSAALSKVYDPDYIFAARSTKESKRPVQTVRPTAEQSGISINDKYFDHEYDKLAKRLLNKKKYRDSHTLICWHHGQIPHLVKVFGFELPKHLNPWPEKVFDYGIWITDDRLQVLPQKLLYNDSAE